MSQADRPALDVRAMLDDKDLGNISVRFRIVSVCFGLFRPCSTCLPRNGSREKVSGSAHSPDDGAGGAFQFELAAQPGDQNIDAAVEIVPAPVVHGLKQMFAAQHASRRGDEFLEEIEFPGREIDSASVLVSQSMAGKIKLPSSEPDDVGSSGPCSLR